MPESRNLKATIADAADTVVAAHYTEVQLRERAAAWQKAAPNATLAEQTAFMLAETRAFTEELLAAVLTQLAEKQA
ncbi:hypothetical protein [Lacticaseibacillus parakribbianus]|uniref:hypothetical protein n=1 Tax=Lacticaseibacillus parakribbianus TaxID=2970927 RepID=UPI0021CB5CF9|nr:hypothetical protein [Lacticaseibacillus parakribbianus]